MATIAEVGSVARAAPVRLPIAHALKDASLSAVVTFGLCFPIVAYRTEQDINNVLVLQSRWGLVLIACAIVFGARLLYNLTPARAAKVKGASLASRIPKSVSQGLALGGLLLVTAYPMLAISATGQA